MTSCNRTWAERYVTGTRNVSIQTLQHRCELPPGHGDHKTKPRKCQCRCLAVQPDVRPSRAAVAA